MLGSPSSWLCNCSSLNFLIYEENFIFFFISEVVFERNIDWKNACYCGSWFSGVSRIDTSFLTESKRLAQAANRSEISVPRDSNPYDKQLSKQTLWVSKKLLLFTKSFHLKKKNYRLIAHIFPASPIFFCLEVIVLNIFLCKKGNTDRLWIPKVREVTQWKREHW